ncbi:MAG TPA: carboxypeptidase regulatory-like domain-containing protein, partial [Pyrinomonadaceae bacterium]|nr:carboxypeptidase regulatory-like domain-containing protein [Pyrinomonadaceae bacterium]
PGLEIAGDGRGCNTLTGSFTVHEVTLDYSGSSPKVLTFAASFEQHCEGGPAALIGTLYYKYTGSQSIYSISGRVIDRSGNAVGGVPVGIKGSKISTVTTDPAGNYSFGNLLAGGNYRIVPKPTASTVYSPESRKFLRLSGNLTGDFTAIPIYKISGRVTDANGAALANTYVTLSGSKSDLVLTNNLGDYSFLNLRSDGKYTVTPSKMHYSFTPPSRSFNGLPGNQTLNFTGTPLKYVLGGRILDSNGVGISGVTVELDGTIKGITRTDSTGAYRFKNLNAGGSYSLKPSKTNYSFFPFIQYFNDLSGNWTSANFTGTLRTYTLSGQVLDSNAEGVADVTVTLSGSQSATATTDSSGHYVINDVPAGGNYTLTPSKAGYSFSPTSRSYNALSDNQANAHFIASPSP